MMAIMAIAASALLSGCQGSDDSKRLYVYNWGEYLDESLIGEFERQTGIKIIYETFATNEDMYTKISAGGSNYDVIFPSDYMVEKMIKEGMLEKIDFSGLPNFENVGDRFKNLGYDPGGEYSVPYMYGTLGILYNKTMVDEPVDSWDILWDEKYARQIFMYDSMRDAFAPALIRLGYSINTTDLEELEEAKRSLIAQKPLVQAYVGDMGRDKMIGGEGALSLTYSGDAYLSMLENPDLDYAAPKEGGNVWFDAMAIPKGARNKTGAEAFINFLCDGEVALKNTIYIGYSTVNMKAFEELPESMRESPVYWPSDDVYETCDVFLDLGDFIKEYDRAWTEILVG
jgi:spermidine/putrescine transport system substrate-binding protein